MTDSALRDLLVSWADLNSGSDNIAGLERMRGALAAEFGTLPAATIEHVALGSDGNLLSAAGFPNLDGLGPIGDHLHSPDEYVHLPGLAQRARIAARFLDHFVAGAIALFHPTNEQHR